MKKPGKTPLVNEKTLSSLRIAGMYLVIGSLWMVFSDPFAAAIAKNSSLTLTLDWIRVINLLVTGLILYGLFRGETGAMRRTEWIYRSLNERFSLAVRAAHLGIWDWDVVKDQLIWDDQMYRLYGIKKEDFNGALEAWQKNIHPDDLARSREETRQALSGEKEYDTEFRVIWPDGEVHYIKAYAQVVRDSSGRALRMTGVNYDITDTRLAEKKIQLEEELLRLTGEMAKVGGWEFDAETLTGAWTEQVARIHDLDPAQPTNVALGISFYSGESRQKIERAIHEAVEFAQPYDLELEMTSASGKHKWVRTQGLPLIQDGKVTKVRAVFQDISDLKIAEMELIVSERKLRALFDLLPVGVSIMNTCGQVISMNSAYEKIVEPPADDPPEKTSQARQYLRSDGTPLPLEDFASARAAHDQKAVLDVETGIVKEDGRVTWVNVSAVPLAAGREVVTVTADITARKHAEQALKHASEELARSNADLEQFAYVASHDLQEPLRAVSGMAELLQRGYEGQLDERADEYITHMIEGTRRMQTLIRDLLAYSRVERSGKMTEPVDSNEVLKIALANLSAAIQESGAKITHDALPVVIANASQLGQVFQNLIGNALKFHGSLPPRVHVSAESVAGEWRFAVQDNGIGIEPQYFQRIFAVFQRLHSRHEYPGNGIGLSICKKIVEAHAGRIWVDSQPEQGSVFYFTIPERRGL